MVRSIKVDLALWSAIEFPVAPADFYMTLGIELRH